MIPVHVCCDVRLSYQCPPLLCHAHHPCNKFFDTLIACSLTHDLHHYMTTELQAKAFA